MHVFHLIEIDYSETFLECSIQHVDMNGHRTHEFTCIIANTKHVYHFEIIKLFV